MEIIGPLNLLVILYTQLEGRNFLATLPSTGSKLATALYVLHYVNRAVISPFFAAPSMSPIHVVIVTFAVAFNWFNSVCLAGWILGFPVDVVYPSAGGGGGGVSSTVSDISKGTAAGLQVPSPGQGLLLPGLGLAVFFIGMIGNIYSERTLFRLRRKEGDKRASSTTKDDDNSSSNPDDKKKNRYSKVYVIPPKQGVFKTILYPHFAFEWIEWLGYALVGTAVFPPATAAAAMAAGAAPQITLAPWLVPAARLAESLRVPLPLPALVFVVNAVTNMLPHARWGRKWYVEKFGEEAVGNRGAAVPWCPWL